MATLEDVQQSLADIRSVLRDDPGSPEALQVRQREEEPSKTHIELLAPFLTFSVLPTCSLCWAQIEAELQAAVSEAQQTLAGLQAGAACAQDASLPQNVVEADTEEPQADEEAGSGAPLSLEMQGARMRAAPAGEPDFAALARKYPDLRKHVRLSAAGRGSIDFTDFEAARCA